MPEDPRLDFVYLTLPERTVPILNLTVAGVHARFQITRDQLFDLNEQIADVLVRNRIHHRNATEQMVLNLEKASTKSG